MIGRTELENARRIGIYGAATTIAGILVSGPLGLLLVSSVQAAPQWEGPASFVAHYHPVQTVPFFGGFLLLFGYVVMIAALHRLAGPAERTWTLVSVIMVTMFAVLILFNYVSQTTFIPALVRSYQPAYDPAITTFSLANPSSLCWAIEMWGYACLGVATWCAATVFDRDRLEKTLAGLMIANGVTSIAGGVIAAIDLPWVFSPSGLVSYGAWNLLVLVLSIYMIVALRRRASAEVNDLAGSRMFRAR